MTRVEEIKAKIDELGPGERGALCPYWHPDWNESWESESARVNEAPADRFTTTERVQQIKAEIDALSPMEQAELNALVQNWPDDEWDKQMRADCEPGGKLHKLMLEAEEDRKAGRLMDWPQPPAG